MNNTYYPWQEQQWKCIVRAYCNDHLAHALLLDGPAGLGKLHFAKLLSQFLLCQDNNKIHTFLPCAICKACRLMQDNYHPDCYFLSPIENSTVIKIDQVKNILLQMNKNSHYHGYTICLIHPAEAMNISSANALLKTLEEPTVSKTIFLLVTNHSMELPATIRSRCQRINFTLPSATIIKNWLEQQGAFFSPQEFEQVSFLTQGSPLLIQQLLNQEIKHINISFYEDVKNFLKERNLSVTQFSKQYMNINLMDAITLFQLIIFELINQAKNSKKSKLFFLLDELNKEKINFLKSSSLNSQLVLENYLIKLLENSYDY